MSQSVHPLFDPKITWVNPQEYSEQRIKRMIDDKSAGMAEATREIPKRKSNRSVAKYERNPYR